MYSIIQFSMKKYLSDNFHQFCFYYFIWIVLWSNIAVLGTIYFLPNFHTFHQPHL